MFKNITENAKFIQYHTIIYNMGIYIQRQSSVLYAFWRIIAHSLEIEKPFVTLARHFIFIPFSFIS